ncbi:hypothetical protein ACHAQH_003617 [Verticillium albo-atrum]
MHDSKLFSMRDPKDVDPYEWDVEKLVSELCGEGGSWGTLNPAKRPDAQALARSLRLHEVDGELLLGWEDEFHTLDTLFSDLGLKKSIHKFALKKAIAALKKRSPAYRKAQIQLPESETTEPEQNAEDVEMQETQPNTVDAVVANRHANRPSTLAACNTVDPGGKPATSAGSSRHSTIPPNAQSPPMEPPQKKRRLVPQFISAEVKGYGLAPIRTAADAISNSAAIIATTVGAHNPGRLYIQDTKLVTSTIVPRSNVRLPTVQDNTNDTLVNFEWVRPKHIPPGTRLQINRAMKRLFRANNIAHGQLANGIAPQLDSTQSSDGSCGDDLLPLFGDSDGEAEYDSDTLREMEEEDNESEKQLLSLHLSKEKVEVILEEFVQGIVVSWTETKLPRLRRKANVLWNQAHRNDRNRQIQKASTRVADLDRRIAKLRAEILIQDWLNSSQLRRQVQCMEASIEDREHQSWLVELLKGREPPRVKLVPGSRRNADPKTTKLCADEEGDLISSETEDSDGNTEFIVNDEMELLSSQQLVPADEGLWGSMDVNSPSSPPGAAGRVTGIAPGRPLEPKVEVNSQLGIVIDLTAADRIITSTARRTKFDQQDVIDLVTPEKPRSLAAFDSDESGPAEPSFDIPDEALDIPFSRPKDIAAISLETWEAVNDSQRLTVAFLWNRQESWRNVILDLIKTEDPNQLWRESILPACQTGLFATRDGPHEEGASKLRNIICRLFCQYISGHRVQRLNGIGEKGKQLILANQKGFADFCQFITQQIIPYFPKVEVLRGNTPSLDDQRSGDEASSEDNMSDNGTTPSKKRRRRFVEDQNAKDNREANLQKQALDEQRRAELQRRLAASATISGDRSRLIINVSKRGDDDKDFVYVNDEIAKRIKDHQIEGVRFMWNQVVMGKQGCLLAHTMGLGKTMQIITLLIAITEASASPDPSIREQIPERLRRSQTLVICPTGLVDNWREELIAWDQHTVLGERYTVDSKQDNATRASTLQEWNVRGGVLIIGYDMLRSLARADDDLRKLLTQRPNIVVADEAHRLKNQKSKLAAIGSQFLTPSRIALTGSPLANNVGEFYSMIDWVADNYLGPLKEFNAYYALPIQEGLYGDSSHSEYRLAKKRLAILEKTVAPKTHRLTIKALKNELPDKVEFFLTVPLTPLQEELYDLYVRSVRENAESQVDCTFAVLDNMILLNNHPRCYYRKLVKEKTVARISQGSNGDLDKSITPAFLTKSMKILNRCQDMNDINLSWKVRVLVTILDECRKVKEKVLIFSQSIPTIDWLSTLFQQQQRPYSRLTGETLPSTRQSMVKNFNEGNNEIFVISTQAGGQGLNITGASRVVIFDFRFNPIAEQQAIGRAYRIGQSKPVVVYRFVSGGTYEQHLYNKAVWKMQLASRVVDKDNPKRWSTKAKDAFTRDYKEPDKQELAEHLGRDSVLDSVLSSPVLSPAIRSIIVTDTFEEEDPNDYIFDAQENQEVEWMVRLENARITNPAEYARLLAENSVREGAQQMQALGYGLGRGNFQHVPGAPGIHLQPSGREFTGTSTIAGRTIPVSMSPAGVPFYTTYAGAVVASPHSRLQPTNMPQATAKQQPQPEPHGPVSQSLSSVDIRPATGVASSPLPVMGANTFMSGNEEDAVTSPGRARNLTPPYQGSPTTGSSPAISRGAHARDHFQQQLIRSVRSCSDFDDILQTYDPEDKARAIAEAVHERLSGRGALPILSSWKTLNLFAQGQSFAAGVLSGLVTVEFLVNTTDDGAFQQRAQELSGMGRWDLKEQLLQALRRPHGNNV